MFINNRKAAEDLSTSNLIYLALAILVLLGVFYFIDSYSNSTAYYEDFYAKELTRIINSAEVGTQLKIDITPLAKIGIRNGKPLRDLIHVDNLNNKIIVSTRIGKGTSFNFFNDVDIVNLDVKEISGSSQATRFIFEVKERAK